MPSLHKICENAELRFYRRILLEFTCNSFSMIIYSAFLTQTTDIEHFLKSLMKSVKDIISRQQSELVRRNKVLKYGRPTYS